MAQSVFLNATADAGAARKADGQDHVHSCSGGASASGALTISYDPAIVTNLTLFDSLLRALRQRAIAGGLK